MIWKFFETNLVRKTHRFVFVCGALLLLALPLSDVLGQDDVRKKSIEIRDYIPQPKLVVATTLLTASCYPCIDAHAHFRFKTQGRREFVERYVTEVMDQNNIAICLSLDATLGAEDEHLKLLGGNIADRFGVLVHIDFKGNAGNTEYSKWAVNQPAFVHTVVEQLKAAQDRGCIGLKFFKQFGLGFRDANGQLIKIDDERFDPIWETCAELNMPVVIHTADPAAFFDPIDTTNERAEELLRHPDWSFHGGDFPTRDELISARNRVIERHPKTQFIGAHVANNSEDLQMVATWLDRYPNLSVDISSRIAELGRKPRQSRDFMTRYANRILFGTDGPWVSERLGYYWRFLETSDEYFRYSEKQPPPQGLWFIDGLDLEEDVLKKIYFQNALRLFPCLQGKYEQFIQQKETPSAK